MIQTTEDELEKNELPLIKKCMENAEVYEKSGDSINAEKWLNLSMKAELYYEKQNWLMAEEYYHIFDEFKEK